MLFRDVVAKIESIADPSLAASWDRSGLQVAATRGEVKKLAVFLDPTAKNVEKALGLGADCLLAHHPLALKPELPNRLDNYHAVLRLLLGADVPLYSAHTSLDVNMNGPSGWLGRALGLADRRILELVSADAGYGEAGDLPEKIPFGSLVDRLLKILNLSEIIWAGPRGVKEIGRVAYCGGSGASLIYEAVKLGAEVFITGDVKYHTALEAPIPVLDVGHHSIEEKMMELFADILKEQLPELRVFFIPSESPFRILESRGEEE